MPVLTDMRKELMTRVLIGMKDAQDYHEVFHKYAYLWKDDQDKVMELFLMYGKLFKLDDSCYQNIPKKSATLTEFKEAVVRMYHIAYLMPEIFQFLPMLCNYSLCCVRLRPMKNSTLK